MARGSARHDSAVATKPGLQAAPVPKADALGHGPGNAGTLSANAKKNGAGAGTHDAKKTADLQI
jgi:hypothetical protein